MAGVKVIEDDPTKEPAKIFGREIRNIPCFRNSFLYGLSGGLVGGLVAFMVTSKASMSNHVGFGSFWITTYVYWLVCRYKHENNMAKFEEVKKLLNEEAQIKADLDKVDGQIEKEKKESQET